MSINQILTNSASPPLRQLQQTPAAAAPGTSFADAILNATRKSGNQKGLNPAEAASAAAELLNLEMMRSALSLGGETSLPAFAPLSIPLTFAMAQAPESQKVDVPATVTTEIPASPPVEFKPHRTPDAVQNIVERASEKYGVDGALIKAVIKAESNFNPSAVSHAGAQGLMQLMPSTARGLGVRDSFNPEQNVMAGTRFLKDMLNRYNGNLDSALAAYNWGPGNVDRKGTSSLPQETREYLSKVKSYYSQYVG